MVRHHHERLNGAGYPDGLAGAEIPLGARIIAVADTFDAVTSRRPYRAARPHREALQILKDDAGVRLDPAVVHAFRSHYVGWRPLAVWGLAAAIPEWLAGLLGAGVASLASVAKVPALAALLGGVAATTSALAVHPAQHHPSGRSPSQAALVAHSPGSTVSASPSVHGVGASPSPPASRRGGSRRTLPARTPAARPSPAPVSSAPGLEDVARAAPAGCRRLDPVVHRHGRQPGTGAGSEQHTSSGGGSGAGAGGGESVSEAGGTVEEAAGTTKGEEVLTGAKETVAATTGAVTETVGHVVTGVKEAPAIVETVLGKLR